MSKKIYLDYQATTPVSKEILEKMIPYFSDNFGNPHSNNHSYGRSASEAVEEARENIANLINSNKEEIIFTSGATESNNFAIKSVAKNYFEKDFQIITCKTEHKCVLESAHELEKEGKNVHYLNVNEDGLIDILDLVIVVNVILGAEELDLIQTYAADMNLDGLINIQDIILIINLILN